MKTVAAAPEQPPSLQLTNPTSDQPTPAPLTVQCRSFRNCRRSPAGHERAARVPLAGGGGSVARSGAELAGGERAEWGHQGRERLQFTVVSHCWRGRLGVGGNGLLSLTNPLLALPRTQYGHPCLLQRAGPVQPGPAPPTHQTPAPAPATHQTPALARQAGRPHLLHPVQ